MRFRTVLMLAMGLLAALAVHADPPDSVSQPASPPPNGAPTPRPAGPGWIDLLDEDRVSGWRANVKPAALFETEDSMLHLLGTESGAYVGYMPERLRDFALHVEFRLAKAANSGIILRGEMETSDHCGLEIQLLEDAGRAPTKTSCGALYGVATPMFNMSLPAGHWNSLDITCQGRVLVVYMNGWKILDVDLAKMTNPIGSSAIPYAQMPLDGFIMVEDRIGEAWFRNFVIKKL